MMIMILIITCHDDNDTDYNMSWHIHKRSIQLSLHSCIYFVILFYFVILMIYNYDGYYNSADDSDDHDDSEHDYYYDFFWYHA